MTSRSQSCLDLVERQFDSLTSPPDVLTVDGDRIGCGLPNRQIPLDELRIILLKRQTTWLTKDAAWRELVQRAHIEPEPWIMATTGMMVPGLKHIGGKLGARFPGDKGDLDSEILEGFLQALDIADPAEPRLYSQLYWAAFRRGHEACNRETRLANTQVELNDACQCTSLRSRHGHPDLVLAEALINGAVTSRQADLISRVHLDHVQRSAAATSLGVGRYEVDRELATAERRLVNYLDAA